MRKSPNLRNFVELNAGRDGFGAILRPYPMAVMWLVLHHLRSLTARFCFVLGELFEKSGRFLVNSELLFSER